LLRQAGKSGIEAEFIAATGHRNCIDIKKGKFPCLDCVRVADELVEKNLQKSPLGD